MRARRGAVAAGHPLTARAGADALRAGGNAVDAALAAVLVSCVAEPLLTGLGAGGYLLVAAPGGECTLLDFFVEAPGRGVEPQSASQLRAVEVSFGDAAQVFHIGAATVGTYGVPAGICAAARRWGSLPLSELAAPAARLAREGVVLNATQAYVFDILGAIITDTPEVAHLFAIDGRPAREGDRLVNPALGTLLERLGAEGDDPFYRGDIAAAICDFCQPLGSLLTAEDLAAYRAIERTPVRVAYRGREVLSNPPPSAGGILIAHALALLEAAPAPHDAKQLLAAMETAQSARTLEFLDGLAQSGFLERFLAAGGAPGRPGGTGATTHISAIDADGLACAVTCSNGEGCGVVVPGTGIHLNNVLGEEDLNPFGFHRHPPGRRLPSMMAPTIVLGPDGMTPELALGSGGSNRIRSAILQVILNVVDGGLALGEAVGAPRIHVEEGVVYAEPGYPEDALAQSKRRLVRFHERNLFFGGVHTVARDRAAGSLEGAGDPRRGGAVALA
ncbi:MAG: gamma-glutamyltransferase [Solirubrobacteraceae bacterium]|nr:MAG: gamma-glutamyltransferase [Solirubrobacterales bacterium]